MNTTSHEAANDTLREEWRNVVGFEGVYEVSCLGRVKRIAPGQGATPGRILRQHQHQSGYVNVALSTHSSKRFIWVHRLVCTAFHGQPPTPEHEVNHKNGVKTDNRVINLEWATKSQNIKHAFRALGRNTGRAKLTTDQVREIRRLYDTGTYTQPEIAKRFGVCKATICLIINRRTWTHI
jgi:hypothetical protein